MSSNALFLFPRARPDGKSPHPDAIAFHGNHTAARQIILALLQGQPDQLCRGLTAEPFHPDANHRRLDRSAQGEQGMEI